jgi:AcrR family transcriptional regulator
MAQSGDSKKPKKTSRAGRPRKVSASDDIQIDKREQILQGALKTFLEYGFAGATMDKITEDAGVSKQTVYSYFKNKEELFVALIEKMVGQFTGGSVTPQMLSMETPILLQKTAGLIIDKMSSWEYVSFLRLLIGESGRFPELSQNYVQRVIQPGQQMLSFYFQKIMQFPDAEVAAWMFNGCLVAYVLRQEILQAKHTMPMPRDRYISKLVDTFLDASTQYKNTL